MPLQVSFPPGSIHARATIKIVTIVQGKDPSTCPAPYVVAAVTESGPNFVVRCDTFADAVEVAAALSAQHGTVCHE